MHAFISSRRIPTLVNDDNPIKNSGAHPVCLYMLIYIHLFALTSNNIHAECPGACLTMSVFDAARRMERIKMTDCWRVSFNWKRRRAVNLQRVRCGFLSHALWFAFQLKPSRVSRLHSQFYARAFDWRRTAFASMRLHRAEREWKMLPRQICTDILCRCRLMWICLPIHVTRRREKKCMCTRGERYQALIVFLYQTEMKFFSTEVLTHIFKKSFFDVIFLSTPKAGNNLVILI